MWDRLWINAGLATMTNCGDAYGSIADGAIAVKDGAIEWLGDMRNLPGAPHELARELIPAQGSWITPGLIDCHTHVVFAGARVTDFEMRLAGATGSEIAKAGGGMMNTVQATRSASHAELLEAADRRIGQMITEGVTTLEVKSGYGLDLDNELKLLRVARDLGKRRPATIVGTFGAYGVPEAFPGGRQAYLDYLCETVLPAAATKGGAIAVDVQVDELGFSKEEALRLLQLGKTLGLMLRAHTDELSDFDGARFMAELGATTADHLEYVSERGVADMAAAGTVAVLLPGNTHILQRKQVPPVHLLRKHGVPMAVATNCNPGPSPTTSLLLMMNMACILYRFTPAEALMGVTRHAAAALGLSASHGTLEIGKAADLAVWKISHPAELSYYLGFNPIAQVVKAGETISDRTADD